MAGQYGGEETENLFEMFLHKNSTYIKYMRHVITHDLEFGGDQCLIRPLKINSADITCFRSFSSAWVDFEHFDDFKPCTLGSIFKKGYSILDAFFSSDPDHPVLPEDPKCKKALELLLEFLNNSKIVWDTLYGEKDEFEWSWTLKLAQHVFTKLSVHPTYKYDIKKSYDEVGCPCKYGDAILGKKGDTSFGWERGWHGKVDILMAGIPVVDTERYEQDTTAAKMDTDTAFSTETGSSISCEVKRKKSDFSLHEYGQIGAETITFSFLKNKDRINEITMIPSIAVNYKSVQVHFYDSINDVFLQSGLIELAQKEDIRPAAILLIWFTVNYDLFYTGIKGTFPHAELHTLIDVEKFSKEIKAPCNWKKENQKKSVVDKKWADTSSFTHER